MGEWRAERGGGELRGRVGMWVVGWLRGMLNCWREQARRQDSHSPPSRSAELRIGLSTEYMRRQARVPPFVFVPQLCVGTVFALQINSWEK